MESGVQYVGEIGHKTQPEKYVGILDSAMPKMVSCI